MPNFLVRVRDGGEAVGLFAVADLDELIYWIDEVTDPADCEYAEIGSGSVVWAGAAITVPAPEHDWDSESRPVLDVIGEHSLGGTWINALLDGDLEFTPCIDDNDGPANEP